MPPGELFLPLGYFPEGFSYDKIAVEVLHMTVKKRPVALEIRERIKKLREKHGYNKHDMADFLGMAPSTYSKYELGLNFFSMHTMRRISGKLDVSIDWLLFGRGAMYIKDNERRQKELEKEVELLKGRLEAERKKHEAQRKERESVPRESDSPRVSNPEVRELLEVMDRVPMLYHEIMLHFQKFKSENPSLVDSPSVPGISKG